MPRNLGFWIHRSILAAEALCLGALLLPLPQNPFSLPRLVMEAVSSQSDASQSGTGRSDTGQSDTGQAGSYIKWPGPSL